MPLPTCSAINYGGLSGSELEQKLNKLYKLGTKEDRGHTPSTVVSQDPCSLSLGEAQPALLLELGFLSLENSFLDLAHDCLYQVPKDLVQGAPKLYVLRDLLSTQLLVARQDGPREIYTKASIQTRVKSLGHMEQLLMSALRIPDPDIVQVRSIISLE